MCVYVCMDRVRAFSRYQQIEKQRPKSGSSKYHNYCVKFIYRSRNIFAQLFLPSPTRLCLNLLFNPICNRFYFILCMFPYILLISAFIFFMSLSFHISQCSQSLYFSLDVCVCMCFVPGNVINICTQPFFMALYIYNISYPLPPRITIAFSKKRQPSSC